MKYASVTVTKYRGKWRGLLKYKNEGGEWKQKTKMLKATGKREAQREAQEWREAMEAEAQQEAEAPARETVADYMGRYIDERALHVERSTLDGYRRMLRRQIAPTIGQTPLDELTPDDVARWVSDLAGKSGPDLVKKSLNLLRSAMRQAVDRDRLAKDPTRGVKPPKKPKQNPNALDEYARSIVLPMLTAERLSPFLLAAKMALYTGMRRGEICGLRWRCVDLEARTLTVEEAIGRAEHSEFYVKDPKTAQSRREIALPPALADSLKARKVEMQKACLAAGVPFSGALYVVGEVDGSFMRPATLSKKWAGLADALDLEGTQGRRVTFHDLRHTYATVAVMNGVDVKTVSSSMGHSNAAMTLNTYASADPDAKRRAADKMGEVFAQDARRGATETPVIPMPKTGTGD